jgi:hypothetical protein
MLWGLMIQKHHSCNEEFNTFSIFKVTSLVRRPDRGFPLKLLQQMTLLFSTCRIHILKYKLASFCNTTITTTTNNTNKNNNSNNVGFRCQKSGMPESEGWAIVGYGNGCKKS